MRQLVSVLLLTAILLAAACTRDPAAPPSGIEGETAQVTRIIDGDTIDVRINEVGYRVRYIGMNTPERDEACYEEATDANAALVSGQTVTLVKDVSETDQFGRLLRYVYVANTFVNQALVRDGWAENAEYPPDSAHASEFRNLEREAAAANRGCHPTGIFDDGSATR
ncbi:MAG: thermonuclease family protein [Chloroflexota bacterium]